MARQQQSSTPLPAPLRTVAAPLLTAASALRKVPGAGTVGRAAEGALDKVGIVSPRGRRIAVYTGAGVLGAAGLVEWPVALTGAAVAWLTQPRGGQSEEASATGGKTGKTTASATGGTKASGGTRSAGGTKASTTSSGSRSADGSKTSGSKSSSGAKASGSKSSSGTKASTGRGKSAATASTSRTKSASSRKSSSTGSTGSSRPKAKSATSGSTTRRGRTTKA